MASLYAIRRGGERFLDQYLVRMRLAKNTAMPEDWIEVSLYC